MAHQNMARKNTVTFVHQHSDSSPSPVKSAARDESMAAHSTYKEKNTRIVCVRYFATITPREEGSVVKWKNAPLKFSGTQLYKALEEEGIELKDHLPQVYEEEILGFSNLDEDVEFVFAPGQLLMKLDVRLTPLKTGTLKHKEDSAPKIILQERPITNPGPLGLFAFALTTMMLMIYECGMVSHAMLEWLVPTAFVYGGACQLFVGMWEIYRNNLFGTIAFSSYGAFWISWGLHAVWSANGKVGFGGTKEEKLAAKCAWLCIWGFFTAMLGVQTLWITRGLQVVFALLVPAFFLLAGGVYNENVLLAGGIFGFLTALAAFYVGVAELMNDLQKKQVLPLGHMIKEHKKYGNSAPGRGATLINDPDQLVSLRARLNKKTTGSNSSSNGN